MNPSEGPKSNELQQAAREFALRSEAANALGLKPQSIELVNAVEFTEPEKPARFLYGFTEADKEPLKAGFFKLSQPENNSQLERESAALTIANRVGIPTVGVLHPYQVTPEGNGLLHVDRLDGENGTVLTSPELIASADPRLGIRAALMLLQAGGREIPADMDSSLLKRGDWRNESPETFWKVWAEQNNIVFSPKNKPLVDKLIGTEKLQAIVDQTRVAIEPEINARTNLNTEYFVHNDASPGNMYFSDKGDSDLLLDFEHAAASHNLTLSQLTDLGNFYGRLWPNPAMQQQLLTSYFENSPDSPEYNYKLLKTVVVFGSMFLSKYAMDPNHHEHQMAISLLSSLEGNLASLDNSYQTRKEHKP